MITYLGIGTNLGDKEENIQHCLRLLQERVGEQISCSSYFYSEPQGFESPNSFVNIVACFETGLSPLALLEVTQQIEREMGRTQKSRWQITNGEKHLTYFDRIIDIDILCYEDLQHTFYNEKNEPILILPHPRMAERDFVMMPLQEIFEENCK